MNMIDIAAASFDTEGTPYHTAMGQHGRVLEVVYGDRALRVWAEDPEGGLTVAIMDCAGSDPWTATGDRIQLTSTDRALIGYVLASMVRALLDREDADGLYAAEYANRPY